MNRTILISIVGLGVLTAAGFARSRAQSASVAACQSSVSSTPVVVVTQPDGNRLVATCVSVSACDPSAQSRSGSTVYTFSAQKGVEAGLSAAQAGAAGVSGQSPSGACSSTGQGTCAVGSGSTVSTTSQEGNQLGHGFTMRSPQSFEPALVHTPAHGVYEAQSPTEVRSLLLARTPRVYSFDLAEGTMTPLVDEDLDVAEEWHVEVERALEEARESLSENQDEMREAWQRAAEEARAAQERARDAYNQAMETYRDAIQKAQEHSREAQERATAERRAQADRGARKSARGGMRGEADARSEHEATLESRIAALEKAARARGLEIDSDRSIEERVAKLEKHSTGGLPLELFARRKSGQPAKVPQPQEPPKAMRLKRTAPVPPVAPVPAIPSPDGRPGQPPQPDAFWKRRSPEMAAPTAALPPRALSDADREQMTRAMEDLKREAARLREELARMRAEVERLPRSDGAR